MEPTGAATGPLPRTQDEARRVAQTLRQEQVAAAPLGGVAVFLRCPSAAQPPLEREYKDIDLVTTRGMVRKLGEVLERLGYAPEKRFNALNGNQRLMYMDHINGRQMDVFVDRFEMCHKFDLRQRVAADPDGLTLPLADLVLTKMQIVEINFKDMQDTAALLQDHPLTDDETGINITYITRLTGSDWGLQRTLEITLTRLEEGENLARLQAESPRFPLESQIAQLREAMQGAPKSTGWKLRAKVGERVKWYEVPEEARG